MDQRIEKWRDWLEHGITNDVYTMHLERHAWDRMGEIIRANDELKQTVSYLWEWLFDVYAKTQASAVRRQADTDPQAASLGRLIFELEQTPSLATRDWWLGLWTEGGDDAYWRGVSEDAWEDKFAGDIGDHFDPAIARADLAELRDGSEKVREYVDRNIAHLDSRTIGRSAQPPTGPEKSGREMPTLDEVHGAVDLIGGLFKKYGNLMTAAAWVDLTPAIQHDWEAVFRTPWLPSGD